MLTHVDLPSRACGSRTLENLSIADVAYALALTLSLSPPTDWLKKAPHKDPQRLRDKAIGRVRGAVMLAVTRGVAPTSKEFTNMCQVLRVTLPLELRTLVVQDVASSQDVHDQHTFVTLLLLHLLTDVQHISLTTDLNTGSWLNLTPEYCAYLTEALSGISRSSLQSLHLEGVTMVNGVMSEILHRSPRLCSIHVAGDDAAAEVLSFIAKNPRSLYSLHLDMCSVTDLEVVHALVRSYNEVGSWDINGDADVDIDEAFPPLCHLSVQSPLVTVCGAVVLLHSLRNLKSFHYSHWNSSLYNLLSYVQQQSPKAAPFGLTSLSLWRATSKAIDTLSLCPRLQTLMMELQTLEIEFEEYTRTPISWATVRAVQDQCPRLQRLELHHLNIVGTPADLVSPAPPSVLVELVQLNLSGVVIPPGLLCKLFVKNVALESLVLDVNQDALTDNVLSKILKNNELALLNYVYFSAGLLSPHGITSLLTLPSLIRLSLHLPGFPFVPASSLVYLQYQLAKGNYQCSVENAAKDD
ncbi:hypothetical protein C7M84_004228 [Penaeus vannamei]|uniref:Uncharacterized protein n=1 Tax=Penaeus vannamei TaxID=6689 RepID=A0A3R7N4N2_PENVA|nr:hypothetical protein C7M84_004228 [Penaeus vannamei]